MAYEDDEYKDAMRIAEKTKELEISLDKGLFAKLHLLSKNIEDTSRGELELDAEQVYRNREAIKTITKVEDATEGITQIFCPICGSVEVVKGDGVFTSKRKVQKYKCAQCSRFFRVVTVQAK